MNIPADIANAFADLRSFSERLNDPRDFNDAADKLFHLLNAPTPVPTFDELVTAEPDRLDKLTDAITNLAALVAPEDAPDPDFDAAPDTPWKLHVTYSDGREELIDKVAEFHLIDARTNAWPTGLVTVDNSDSGRDVGQAVVGGWDTEGTFRKHDDRRMQRRPRLVIGLLRALAVVAIIAAGALAVNAVLLDYLSR